MKQSIFPLDVKNFQEIDVNPLVLVSTKNVNPISLTLPSSYDYIEVAFAQVLDSKIYEIYKKLHFGTEEGWFRLINPDFRNLELPKIFRSKQKQKTSDPIFRLLFRYENQILCVSKKFITRSKWNDTKDILKRISEIRKSVYNQKEIEIIEELKKNWNGKEVEKATQLQVKLVNDKEENLSLIERVKKYFKNSSLTLKLAQEVQKSLASHSEPNNSSSHLQIHDSELPCPPVSPVPIIFTQETPPSLSNKLSSQEIDSKFLESIIYQDKNQSQKLNRKRTHDEIKLPYEMEEEEVRGIKKIRVSIDFQEFFDQDKFSSKLKEIEDLNEESQIREVEGAGVLDL